MITLFANGSAQCQLTEVERYHDMSGSVFVTYDLSEPIEFVRGIAYEIGKEGMINRRVEPTAFKKEASRVTLKLL